MVTVKYFSSNGQLKQTTSGSSGIDLSSSEEHYIAPGDRLLVGTGITVEIPPGYEGQIRPRSGLAIKHGLGIVNSPGTIDSDYRGEIKVILINHGNERIHINAGDRIAQLIIQSVPVVYLLRVVDILDLNNTERGTNGFGSTGK